MAIEVVVLRVFTDASGEHGNELGVIEADRATAGREQAIAAELGFSETVFLDGYDPSGGGIGRARIFTPATELPFAGHPTVGLGWHLAHTGRPVAALDVPAGQLAVTADDDETFVAAKPEWSPAFAWVQLGSPAEVEALDPDAAPDEATYYWAWVDEGAGAIRSRMFGRALGVREDEATGSAAVALSGRLGRDLSIVQGSGSPVATRVLGEFVAVGGRTVHDRVIALD